MSSSDNHTSPPPPPLPEPAPAAAKPRKFGLGRRERTTALSVSLILIGAIAGAGALRLAGGVQSQTAFVLQPSPITSMSEWTPAAIKGQVAEVFGNKFIIADASGSALVETGREGEGGRLVKPNETVTVQGRFERGFLHASVIQHEDGQPTWSAHRRARTLMAQSPGCGPSPDPEAMEPSCLDRVEIAPIFVEPRLKPPL